MVTERRGEFPHRDIREGGVAARFRPLAGVGDVLTGDTAACPASSGAPPVFATVPWGYRRAEVDSWASWVAALLAHGRNETVRADSAEATLKATLARLEQLQDRSPDGANGPTRERPGAGPDDATGQSRGRGTAGAE
ncbi:hypothetical protein [Pseudonocardia sp. KRD291]|uniref:hypothetical protein n=1 Tax=Pseudonocardia sp. KRD291 TaxID=2792007 RepID=UPI001C49CAED|nr:hypothetical protein [Pseudonocardia sp. KRD291]MBW0104961.1 hypothetical protein [Pseudonocardia sp. KRD291]